MGFFRSKGVFPVKKNAAALAQVLPESPATAAAPAPNPAAELAAEIEQIEQALPKASLLERGFAQEKQALHDRSEELAQSISSDEAVTGTLEVRLAAGEDVSTEIDAQERKVKGLKSTRNGVNSLLAIKEGEQKAAEAEVGGLSELLARKRTEREMCEAADAADAADSRVYELSAKLIEAIPEQERTRAVLCDRFREAGGIAVFNSRILAKRAARREEAVKALRGMPVNQIFQLNRFVAD
jgi:hypothetical protein